MLAFNQWDVMRFGSKDFYLYHRCLPRKDLEKYLDAQIQRSQNYEQGLSESALGSKLSTNIFTHIAERQFLNESLVETVHHELDQCIKRVDDAHGHIRHEEFWLIECEFLENLFNERLEEIFARPQPLSYRIKWDQVGITEAGGVSLTDKPVPISKVIHLLESLA